MSNIFRNSKNIPILRSQKYYPLVKWPFVICVISLAGDGNFPASGYVPPTYLRIGSDLPNYLS